MKLATAVAVKFVIRERGNMIALVNLVFFWRKIKGLVRKVSYEMSCHYYCTVHTSYTIAKFFKPILLYNLVHPCDKATKGGCSQICNKRNEWYICSCKVGFVLRKDNMTCNKGEDTCILSCS